MSAIDPTVAQAISGERTTVDHDPRQWFPGSAIPLLVVVGGVAAYVLALNVARIFPRPGDMVVAIAVLASVLLALAPLLISFAHAITRDRQLSKLDSLNNLDAAKSSFYEIAIAALKSIRPAVLNNRYFTIPMISFAVSLLIRWLMVLLTPLLNAVRLAQNQDGLFSHHSFLLGGINAVSMVDKAALEVYQAKTFTIISMAFVGSYVYIIGRLLDRVNTNDLYPMSYYFYIGRIIVACLVADVFWLVFGIFGIAEDFVIAVGFVIGFVQPDLFLIALSRRVFQALKFRGDQADPDGDALPTNLSLLMIEGMSRNQADRLLELGIENAEVLATQNPFLMLARTPYELSLILKWIGQAQLYIRVKEAGIKALRLIGITEISDLLIALKDDTAKATVATALTIPLPSLGALAQAIETDPSYIRLADLRAKLH